jgi:TetR/AcrR family transcriptional repressor of nem operon
MYLWLANLIRGTSAKAKDKRAARSRAIMSVCALVGAITVSRAVSDQHLSRAILNTVARLAKNPKAA